MRMRWRGAWLAMSCVHAKCRARARSRAHVVELHCTRHNQFTEMSARDPEMSARCSGLGAQFSSFSFLFGVFLGHHLLSLADNLSVSLQSKRMSAAEAQELASLTLKALGELRSDTCFQSFWADLDKKREACDIDIPAPPRRRKPPARYAIGDAPAHFPESVEDHFRAIYFEAVDTVTGCIKQRFDQPGYKQYSILETLLLVKKTIFSRVRHLQCACQYN